MLSLLSSGAVTDFVRGEKPDNPVVQVLGIKKMDSSGTERYRLLLSDGEYTLATTMLATQLNHMVVSKQIEQFCIMKINKYQVSFIPPSKHIIVCLDVDVLKSDKEVGGRLGSPLSSNQIPANAIGSSSSTKKMNGTTNGAPNNVKVTPPKAKIGLTKNTTPQTPGGTAVKVVPIASLTPYQNKWTIKARVTQKGDVREWKNARGEGKLFSFTMVDESGDIRATCFKDEVDKFFELVEPGKIYYISNCSLKPANQQYNNTSHDYEMTMRRESAVVLCDDADESVPQISYNFIPIEKLSSHINSVVDVIGVIKEVDEVQSVMIRSQNRETKRRNITIVDRSNTEIRCTFWGDKAESGEDYMGNPVIAVKGARVSDFSGCSMSTINSTMIQINPDIPEAFDLKHWYDTKGSSETTTSLTSSSGGSSSANWSSLGELNDMNMTMDDKPQYITCKASVLLAKKENVLYQACSSADCNKKVVDLQNGSYRCEKCEKDMQNFNYRMILNMNLADDSHSMWVTCFQDAGEKILGCSAAELGRLKDEDEASFHEVMDRINFKSFMFQLRAKMDRYNDEERLRVVVINVAPIHHEDYGKKLLADIQKLAV